MNLNISLNFLPQYTKNLKETALSLAPIVNISSKKIIALAKKSIQENGLFFPASIKGNLKLDEILPLQILAYRQPKLKNCKAA